MQLYQHVGFATIYSQMYSFAELTRFFAELTRNFAELTRIFAELTRISAELTRIRGQNGVAELTRI